MNTIKRAVLIALALVLEAADRKITEEQNRLEEATQKPTEQPLTPSPTKYETAIINTSNEPYRPHRDSDMSVYRYPPLTGEQVKDKFKEQGINSRSVVRPYIICK